jgi:hypothetical protein
MTSKRLNKFKSLSSWVLLRLELLELWIVIYKNINY